VRPLSRKADSALHALAHNPRFATPTVDRAVLAEILHYTEGRFTTYGRTYDVRSEHLGAGVYRLRLDEGTA
jgi:hypothetical protein